VSKANWGGFGTLLYNLNNCSPPAKAPDEILIQHNTAFVDQHLVFWDGAHFGPEGRWAARPYGSVAIKNNLGVTLGPAIRGRPVWYRNANVGFGVDVMEAYAPGKWTFSGNVFSGQSGGATPATNTKCGKASCWPKSPKALGLKDYVSCNGDGRADFVKYDTSGAYPPGSYDPSKCALDASSPYFNAVSEDRYPGADIQKVLEKTAGVDK
jgi:hypothetical protein